MLVFASSVYFSAVPNVGSQTESSNSIVLKLDFLAPEIALNVSGSSVTMPTLPQYGAPGEPVLPFRQIRILIPEGKGVKRVDVTPGNREVLQGRFNVMYGKTPMPISSNVTAVDKPNEAIYSSTNPFPSSLYSDISEQYLTGYKILLLKIYPVQYVPRTGELYYFETMTITVALEETGEISSLFRNLPQDRAQVVGMVDNPDAAKTYTKTPTGMQYTVLAGSLNHYDYVVITNNTLRSSFQPLVDWKNQKGLNATIVLIEDIMKNPKYNSDGQFGDGNGSPKFNDTQAHVRNFIKDAYLNWGTQYVLLGGDDDIIPARGIYDYAAYDGSWTDYNIPSDMYYGSLDGSWDKNNDTIFGEAVYHWPGPENGTAGEEADFFAEVYVGRAPVDTPQEATNFVNKTIAYEQSTQADYLKKALVIGTKLDDITEGGNGEDTVTDIIPQYTTTRLYQRDGTFSRTAVINEMNSGTHIINHDGHSNYQSAMGLSISDVDSLTNTQYFFVYSMGCYSAAFDEATSGSQQAIAEHFLFSAHGAFAYIGNSRYGWYCSASLDGPGERYDRSFFSVLNSGTRNLGKALQLSKEQEPILDRWTYFDLNLLGDPETEIVTAISAPTAHFKTRTDLLTPPRFGGLVGLQGIAKRGTTPSATFSNYTLAFGSGTAPTSWMTTGISLANNGKSEVVNGTLATWNTTGVAQGTYTLKLTVFDVNGLVGEDRQIVVVSTNALPVHIRADGSVDPPTAPIQHNGDVYTLSGNIYSDSEGIVIERNNIMLDGAGYTVQGSGGGAAGIYLLGRSNVTIKNVAVETHLYGIYLQQCSNNTILGTDTSNNIHGIFLLESSNNNVVETNVTNNYDGISLLSFSDNNSVTGCRITGNNGPLGSGIYLYMSSNNLIYDNIFANELVHVFDAVWDCADPGLIFPSINTWDKGYPSGGNYWDDYTGTDHYKGPCQNVTGSDGIGDTSYQIDMNNIDNYPLMSFYTPGHDVAVTDITPLKTVAGQGYCMNVSVAIANYGTFDENFNLSVFADSTLIAQTATSLTAANAVVIIFLWDTTGFAYGNHTLSAYVPPVSGETNTANNNRTCTIPVHVGVPGDVSSTVPGVYDGVANMKDVAYMIALFNTKPNSPNWKPNADVNNDGVCNMKDIAVAIHYFNNHE
ncbi:MAG: C25 family cysteine peptidase [Candidatus Bathyarchaeia archaeon]|jgi:parallel beta-helix repeat protein